MYDVSITVTYNDDNDIETWTELIEEDGIQVWKRYHTYTYYSTKEVNWIQQYTYSTEENLVKHVKIKHFKNQQPPNTIVIKDDNVDPPQIDNDEQFVINYLIENGYLLEGETLDDLEKKE